MPSQTHPNPYERIDALEVITRQQALQIAALATGLATLSMQHAALCAALGQDALPGEQPLPPEAKPDRKAKGH